ncbi:MAG: ParB/RepB/Spo0J family partition protein [Candidatus Pacebacteria bacterium]|nr:ParB/RepB/Spo0J family partition protein [Candidatus Paceibacterota bacterium]
MSNLYSNSIFFIDTDKIFPNPYQPRREFEEGPLNDLADSIRQYGVLQPLTVSRIEKETPDGGLVTEYELIAGERRLRASKLAGISQVPVIIRVGDDPMMKLELAIIENVQREDLNAVERARAYSRLAEEFKFTHAQIGQKVGKSREHVSNSMRLLLMPQEFLDALSAGKINEGHTRPLLMLSSRPEEQMTLFKEIVYRKISVREAERIARRIATDKARKKELLPTPELLEIEKHLQDKLGTRVHIQQAGEGGKITIDYFSNEDLDVIVDVLGKAQARGSTEENFKAFIASKEGEQVAKDAPEEITSEKEEVGLLDDRSKEEVVEDEKEVDDLYNIKNFSL